MFEGCRPFRKPTTPPPAPQINVQADPRVGNSLSSIDRKLDQVVVNTTPPPVNEEKNDEELNPMILVAVIVGSAVLAFVVFFKNN